MTTDRRVTAVHAMEPLHFLARLRSGLRRIIAFDGLARMVLALGLGLVLLVLLDWLPDGHLPAVVRAVLLAVGLCLAGWYAWRRLWSPLRVDLGNRALARIAERRLPECNGRLFTAVDGLAMEQADEAELRRICAGDALRRLLRTDAMRTSLSAAATLTLVLLGFGLWWPDAGVGVRRALLPWTSAEWPRAREITAQLREEVVGSDAPLVVEVARTRGSPAGIDLAWTTSEGLREGRSPDGLKGPWTEALSLALGDYVIDVSSPDAETVRLPQARVRARPALRRLAVTVTPPAYTGLLAETLDGPGNLSLYRGTTLTVAMEAVHGADAVERELRLVCGEQVATLRDEAGKRIGELRVDAGGAIVVHLVDRYQDSRGSLIALPARPEPRIALALLQDLPPSVTLGGVRNQEQVTVQARLRLDLSARDDLGLGTLELHRGTAGTGVAAAGAEPAANQPAAVTLEKVYDYPSALGQRETGQVQDLLVKDHAAEGQRLHLRARATDRNDVDGPGVGLSEELVLLVVSPEALRQELDRLLAEVRDRVGQARDQLAPALDDAERLPAAARTGRAFVRRAGEQLADTLRRWHQNNLDAETLPSLEQAEKLLNKDAVTGLEAVAEGGEQAPTQAREADRSLAQVESLLNQLLNSGDLARQLSSLMARQGELSQSTREFLKAQLEGNIPKQTLELRQQDLAARQKELGERLREWEHQLQSTQAENFSQARELARAQQPANRLGQAASALGGAGTLSQAGSEQAQALVAMKQLLDLLRGSDQVAEFARRAQDLADRQKNAQERLEEGARPQDLTEEQKDLNKDTQALLDEVAKQDDLKEATGSLQGARGAQNQAQGAMSEGKSQPSTAAAGAAATLLQRAAEQLREKSGKKEEKKDEEEQGSPDVLALLRALHIEQQRVVNECIALHERLLAARVEAKQVGEYAFADLGFRDKREHGKTSQLQEEVLLRLREEGLKHLADMPIVVRALARVDAALERSQKHLATPALGSEGVRKATIALYELERLLAIVDGMPPPQQEEGEGGNSPGQGNPPAFPPRAQLGLLLAEQRFLRWLTAVRHPKDLVQHQEELLQLSELIMGQTRPGTRPQLLMQRVLRAMASAKELLEGGERGATVQTEQDAAVAALYRILEEQKNQSGKGDSKPQNRDRPRDQGDSKDQQSKGTQSDQQQSQKQPGDAKGDAAGSSDPSGSNANSGEAGSTTVEAEALGPWVPQLPPQARDALEQGLEDNVPVEAYNLWRRYLELRRQGR